MRCDMCSSNIVETAKGSISDKYVWKCQTKTCLKYKSTKSIRDCSILIGFKLPLSDCIDLIYRFANEKQQKDTLDNLELCRRSIHKFYKKLRMLCHEYMNNNPVLLGGNGIIVQIYETCLCHKHKFNRGRATGEQIWIFGIVDTSYTPARVYIEIVQNRTKETLIPIIERVVAHNSIIHSDEWASYRNISLNLYEHGTVRHKLVLVPEYGSKNL
ncbi:hypothetical protein DMUE_2278 [Dictyocoela muelleri]|nr:hypothetical protein DMUE_2278 [Dictyocoela muelleri]